jgi:hypothetical protein
LLVRRNDMAEVVGGRDLFVTLFSLMWLLHPQIEWAVFHRDVKNDCILNVIVENGNNEARLVPCEEMK